MSRLFEAARRASDGEALLQQVDSAGAALPNAEALQLFDHEAPDAPQTPVREAVRPVAPVHGQAVSPAPIVAHPPIEVEELFWPEPVADPVEPVDHDTHVATAPPKLAHHHLRAQKMADAHSKAADRAAMTAPGGRYTPEHLVTDEDWAPTFAEYRKMAATLLQMQSERGIRTLVVTSAVPSEGKSLTAANLAFTLADVYRRRVLLVDGDMRRPQLHRTFNTPLSPGLGECLHERGVVHGLPIPIRPGLSLLPAGRADGDPGSHLITITARQFIAGLAEQYDWVIVDTPPAAILPDAELLAALVDMVVLVIEAGKTKYADVDRVVTNIGRDRIAGVVLNRMPPGSDPSQAYYNYSSYYYDDRPENT